MSDDEPTKPMSDHEVDKLMTRLAEEEQGPITDDKVEALLRDNPGLAEALSQSAHAGLSEPPAKLPTSGFYATKDDIAEIKASLAELHVKLDRLLRRR